MYSRRMAYSITILLLLLLFIQELPAGEQLETLNTYFRKFAVGEKTKTPDSWFSPDKGYHLVGSMVGTTLLGQISQRGFDSTPQESRYYGAGITFSFGLAKEFYDSGKPHNIFSWKDLTANCVGILLGVILLGVY